VPSLALPSARRPIVPDFEQVYSYLKVIVEPDTKDRCSDEKIGKPMVHGGLAVIGLLGGRATGIVRRVRRTNRRSFGLFSRLASAGR
jgi:hypothetical protein